MHKEDPNPISQGSLEGVIADRGDEPIGLVLTIILQVICISPSGQYIYMDRLTSMDPFLIKIKFAFPSQPLDKLNIALKLPRFRRSI